MQLQPKLSRGARRSGVHVASWLRSAWRTTPSPLDHSLADLLAVGPFLLESGAGALAWWRVRTASFRDDGRLVPFRNAYRVTLARSTLDTERIAAATRVLHEAGIQALLGKGLAAARAYGDRGLRPSGDIDLYVRAEQFAAAVAALAKLDHAIAVDLHREVPDHGRPWHEVYRRSRIVFLGGTEVRLFGDEDHLRLLVFHLLRHGAVRPLWLCDVAAALEARGPHFDWDYLRGEPGDERWIACTLGLAHVLLDARLDGAPAWIADRHVPSWMISAAAASWGGPYLPHGRRESFSTVLHDAPLRLGPAIALRWPNGIEATLAVGGPLNDWPRLPFQLAECLRRGARQLLQRA